MAGKVIICDNNVSASGGGAWSKNCRVIELSSISSKTVELSNYRAGTSKLSQYLSLEQRWPAPFKVGAARTPSLIV